MIITPYAFFSTADIKSVIPAIPKVKKYAKIKHKSFPLPLISGIQLIPQGILIELVNLHHLSQGGQDIPQNKST